MMNAPALSTWRDAEINFLEGMRARYEAEGFSFNVSPSLKDLPDFFGNYLPDAIAQRGEMNVAIEVKRHQSSLTQQTLQEIRRLFEGRPDWQLSVVFMGAEPNTIAIPPAAPAAILSRISEVRALDGSGHHREALVMGWSLLEAALRSLNAETTSKPRTPGTVVQTLAMNGYIDPETERPMRALIELRNRIVHGDLDAEPTSDDVQLLLSAIEQALTADAA